MGKTVYLKEFTTEKLQSTFEDKFKQHLLETDRAKSLKVYSGDVKRFRE
ncbi:MAG: hypothetical protein PHT62_05320 [Desulfotomaculaceae bacterium]|nr:hypothetical protein [Desulfotomaculaceae bacterium]